MIEKSVLSKSDKVNVAVIEAFSLLQLNELSKRKVRIKAVKLIKSAVKKFSGVSCHDGH